MLVNGQICALRCKVNIHSLADKPNSTFLQDFSVRFLDFSMKREFINARIVIRNDSRHDRDKVMTRFITMSREISFDAT